jgi:hypothetical protein
MHTRVDAAVPADAQNAPTGTWKTAQNAVSHSAHTQHRQRALHTKILTLPGEAATKLIWLALRTITAGCRRAAPPCRAAMNQFATYTVTALFPPQRRMHRRVDTHT